MDKINIDKLEPLEMHVLLYDLLDKLESMDYVYDEENRETHYDYFVSNKTAHYDAREERTEMKEKYG